ncbi:hypothetical protein BZG29_18395 [Janthinobacterium sp. LM6]|uniref:hypothetical protein n=1 Tax=Janthinobacterium sp. LM6 TaxID=1938606 RepID=UPI000983B3B4|nr:hypothetical protein [Janthinobacterium sp. LM6]AQR70078.1 hypothetical protein BZG29_18395 [Janthinobacterium sp. LM6]
MSTRHTPAPAKLPKAAAFHVPFSHLDHRLKDDQDAQFAAITMDIARGIGVCLEIASNSDLAREMNADADPADEDLPVLGPVDTYILTRFAISAARLLADQAEDRITWMNEYCVKEAK